MDRYVAYIPTYGASAMVISIPEISTAPPVAYPIISSLYPIQSHWITIFLTSNSLGKSHLTPHFQCPKSENLMAPHRKLRPSRSRDCSSDSFPGSGAASGSVLPRCRSAAWAVVRRGKLWLRWREVTSVSLTEASTEKLVHACNILDCAGQFPMKLRKLKVDAPSKCLNKNRKLKVCSEGFNQQYWGIKQQIWWSNHQTLVIQPARMLTQPPNTIQNKIWKSPK